MPDSYLKTNSMEYGLGYAGQSIGKPCIFVNLTKSGSLQNPEKLMEALRKASLMYQIIDGGRIVFRHNVEDNFPGIQSFAQAVADEYGSPPYVQAELAGRDIPGQRQQRWIDEYMVYVCAKTDRNNIEWYKNNGCSSFCFDVKSKDQLLDYALKWIYKYELPFTRVYIEMEEKRLAKQVTDKGFTAIFPTYITYRSIDL